MLEYPFDDHPTAGTTREVAPGVRWLTMPMGGSLAHINLYLLEDVDGWYVVDTGLDNEQTRDLWHDIFRTDLGGKSVKGVICTHMHPDHTGTAGHLTEHWKAPLFMSRAEYYQARSFSGGHSRFGSWEATRFYRHAGLTPGYFENMRKRFEEMTASKEASKAGSADDRQQQRYTMPQLPMAYHRLQDGDVLSIGGHDWTIVVGSGHSPEHACLHCASLGVLIAGDQILPVITSNVSVHPTEPEANPLKSGMDSHDRFLALPEKTFVLPAHNLPFYGVRERLRELIDRHEDRMLAIEESCAEEPRLAVDLLPVLFKRKLDDRQIMMALGECIAHLHLLRHRDRLDRLEDNGGRLQWRSIDPGLERRSRPERHEAPDDAPVEV